MNSSCPSSPIPSLPREGARTPCRARPRPSGGLRVGPFGCARNAACVLRVRARVSPPALSCHPLNRPSFRARKPHKHTHNQHSQHDAAGEPHAEVSRQRGRAGGERDEERHARRRRRATGARTSLPPTHSKPRPSCPATQTHHTQVAGALRAGGRGDLAARAPWGKSIALCTRPPAGAAALARPTYASPSPPNTTPTLIQATPERWDHARREAADAAVERALSRFRTMEARLRAKGGSGGGNSGSRGSSSARTEEAAGAAAGAAAARERPAER